MMAVGIDDGHTQRPEAAAQVFDHHGFHVHVAEAAVAVGDAHGVMSRRPHQGEGPLAFPGKHEFPGPDGASRRGEVRCGAHAPDVRQAEVHPLDIFIRGHAGFVLGNARKVEQPLLAELILRIQQALFTFRMRRADRPVERREKDDAKGSFAHGKFLCEITGGGRRKTLKREFSLPRAPIPHLPRQLGWWGKLCGGSSFQRRKRAFRLRKTPERDRSGVWICREIRSTEIQ